ncbi:MAG TPA: hypothetical protein ENN43_04195, partial [bacterium]|nr:hypothetical protein [bacterium]
MADTDDMENKPKDITPNPLEDAAPAEEQSADSAEQAPGETAPAGGAEAAGTEPEEPAPKNTGEFINKTFIESRSWNTVFQFILVITGAYFVFLGIKGQELSVVPAAIGVFLIAIAAFYDHYILGKFGKNVEQLSKTMRLILAGILALIGVLFVIQIFKPFDQVFNKTFVMAGLIAVAAVFAVDFFLYIKNNKNNLISDLMLFASVALGFAAVLSFYNYYVIISFVFAALSLGSLLAALNKDPLKDDFRFGGRVMAITASVIMFAAILIYASSIFRDRVLPAVSYGVITDKYADKPENLSWSGDSWSFAYNIRPGKKRGPVVGVINALTMGKTELPPKEGSDIKMPDHVDAPLWNNNGTHLIMTAGDTAGSPRQIWAVKLNVSLIEAEKSKAELRRAEKAEKQRREDENIFQDLIEYVAFEQEKVTEEKKLRTARDDKLNLPVGKPKVLLADMNVIIDGRDCAPITHRTAWAPDGSKFVYAAKDSNSKNYNLWAADVQGQKIERITSGFHKMMPLWSPAGGSILYVSKQDSYTYLKVSNYDGSDARELNIKKSSDAALFPLWNKAESRVLFIKDGVLTIMHANATNQRVLSRSTLAKSDYWMTDTKRRVKLEYTDSGNIWRVWTINPNGKNNKKIFEEVCEGVTQPKWSYDGKTIAIGVNYGKTGSLWKFEKDGSHKTRLYTSPDDITELEWSPYSNSLAFIAHKNLPFMPWEKGKTRELWVIDRDGTNARAVYETPGEIEGLSWDDQGKRIAFGETAHRFYFR